MSPIDAPCATRHPSHRPTRPAAWQWLQGAEISPPPPALSDAEAQRVGRLRERLMQAWSTHDPDALHQAKQQVLHAAWGDAATPAARQVLRQLAWRMAALITPRRGPWTG